MRRFLVAAFITLALTAQTAFAAGDPAAGKLVFVQCSTCHSLVPGKNRIGPGLHGLIGRKSGTAAGYNYSAAMKNAGIIWNEDTLTRYLAGPKLLVPGNKMPFLGVPDPQKRADVVAYLMQATQ
jgi:cytochrome c